jgi:hypothetical protein
MRAINHALTGALIGLVVTEPAAAIPLSIVSHYVLDITPHHGLTVTDEKSRNKWIASKLFRNLIYIDAVLCSLLVLLLAASRPQYWLLAAFCAFFAAAPDLLSFNRYQKTLESKKWKAGWYSRFAAGIQWFERPIGGVVEVAWFVAMIIMLSPFFRG